MMTNLDRRSDWRTVSFGDVATHVKDRVRDVMACGLQEYIRGEHFEPANLRLIGRSTLGDGKHGSAFCMRFRPGDVLYVSRNPQLRKAAVADFEGICANTTYVCRAKEEYLLQDLLPFIMQTESFVEYTIRNKRGSTNFYLNWSDIAGYEFALPPLDEQRRIVEVLQAADMSKNTCVDALLKLQQAGVALGHARAAAHAETYPIVDLESVADIKYGLTVNQARKKSAVQAPYLRVANVERGTLDLSEVKEIGVLDGDDFDLHFGDVLIVEGHANPNEIGRAAVWQNEIPGMLHQNHLIRARCGEGLDHRYLCMLINSPHGMVHFQSRAKSSSGLNTINSTVVKNYRIPLPPIEIQEQVAAELAEINRSRASLYRRFKELDGVRSQLLRAVAEESDAV